MTQARILKGAEEAMRFRIEALHRRHDAFRARYCGNRGGHDWTEWQRNFRESVAGGYITTRHRWCLRCCSAENEDVDDAVTAPLPAKEKT